MLRDFPEDGLKVSMAETGTLPLTFLVQCMELGELNVKSHVLMLNLIKYIIYISMFSFVVRLAVDRAA